MLDIADSGQVDETGRHALYRNSAAVVEISRGHNTTLFVLSFLDLVRRSRASAFLQAKFEISATFSTMVDCWK